MNCYNLNGSLCGINATMYTIHKLSKMWNHCNRPPTHQFGSILPSYYKGVEEMSKLNGCIIEQETPNYYYLFFFSLLKS